MAARVDDLIRLRGDGFVQLDGLAAHRIGSAYLFVWRVMLVVRSSRVEVASHHAQRRTIIVNVRYRRRERGTGRSRRECLLDERRRACKTTRPMPRWDPRPQST